MSPVAVNYLTTPGYSVIQLSHYKKTKEACLSQKYPPATTGLSAAACSISRWFVR
jgi:hypothetical protein